jgi:hypothetical protein
MKRCEPRQQSRSALLIAFGRLDLIDSVLPLEPNRPVRMKRNFKVIERKRVRGGKTTAASRMGIK